MSNIDEQIRKALSAQDQKAIDELDEQPGLFELIGETFKGKQAWMSYYMYFVGIVVFIAGLYSLNQFFATPDIKTSLSWALAITACFFILAIVKVIGWQQIQKAEIMRELKRLEMRIMLLSGHDRKADD